MLSRNSASSRAIPTEKMIERVRENPFVPATFNRRVKGMGVGEALDESQQEEARYQWLRARDDAVEAAEWFAWADTDKSRANRLLEPFMWHTAIISATEWDNFFALRDHPAAQPEFQIVARLMREELRLCIPVPVDYGEWHLPLVHEDEHQFLGIEALKKISASRCARVSYDKHTDTEPIAATLERADRLIQSGHLSPFEHVARPMGEPGLGYLKPSEAFLGNFRGWVQYRKEIANEENFQKILDGEECLT
jgi:hypothetical protein